MTTIDALAARFMQLDGAACARLLERQTSEDLAEFLSHAAPEARATVLTSMAPNSASDCFAHFDEDIMVETVNAMPHETLGVLFRQLPSPTPWVDRLAPTTRKRVQQILRFGPDTAAALANPAIGASPDDITVEEALQRSRRRRGHGPLPYIYFIDRHQRLTGVASHRELRQSLDSDLVSTVMRQPVSRVSGGVHLDDLAALATWQDYDTLPVVDSEGRFLGAIRHKELRRAIAQRSRRKTHEGGLGAVMEVGEAYWTGLSTLMFAFGGTATPSPEQGSPS